MTALLSQQSRGDRGFERIYRRHVGDVYRYALAVLRNPADAEDVAQTTFMNAYRAYAKGERPRNPHNWLISIAHNVCRQRFRQSLRRPDEVELDDTFGEPIPEEDRGPSAADIQRALGQLAFNQRAALVMRELEGRSYAEIAEILGTSIAAVETLIFRARRALREQLEGALTCGEAERAISRAVDGHLSRTEKSALRAHLRACPECDRFARSQRAQRKAIRALGAIPVPTSLTSLFGGGGGAGAVAAGGVATKAAAVVAAGTVATGVAYEGTKRFDVVRPAPGPAATAQTVGAAGPERTSRGTQTRPVGPTARAHASVVKPVKQKSKPANPRSARAIERTAPPGLVKKATKTSRAAKTSPAKRPVVKAKTTIRTHAPAVQRGRPHARRDLAPQPKRARVTAHGKPKPAKKK